MAIALFMIGLTLLALGPGSYVAVLGWVILILAFFEFAWKDERDNNATGD